MSFIPMISIIVPNFNKAKFVVETLENIKNQSFVKWECIIIDDGSSDNSVKLINDFTFQDNRFRFFIR